MKLTTEEDRRCLARLALALIAAVAVGVALALSAKEKPEPSCSFGVRSIPSAACGNMEFTR